MKVCLNKNSEKV